MIIYRKFKNGVLRAPEGGEGGGGGAGAAVAEGHEAEAGKLFGETPAPAAKPEAKSGDAGGGGETPEAKAAREKAAAAAKPGDKKPASVFDKFPGKKAEAAKPGAGDPPPVDPNAGDEDKIALDDKAAPQTKTQFEALKKITKTLRGQTATLAAELAAAKKAAPAGGTSPEVETLKAQHKALSDRLALVDLQNHPDFVRQFVEPKTKLVTGLNSVLADNKVEGVDLAGLLSKPRPEFAKTVSEIAAKLPAFEQAAFLADMRQLHTLDAQAKEQLGKSAEIGNVLKTKTEAAARTAFEDTWKGLDFVGDGLQPFDIPADASAEDKTAYEAYNKGIGEIRTAAEQIAFGRMDEKGAALTATKAATFDFLRTHAMPRMEAEYKKAVGLIEKLTEEITALKGSRGAGGAGGGGNGGGGAEESHEAAAGKVFSR